MRKLILVTMTAIALAACAPGKTWEYGQPGYSQQLCINMHDRLYGDALAKQCPAP